MCKVIPLDTPLEWQLKGLLDNVNDVKKKKKKK